MADHRCKPGLCVPGRGYGDCDWGAGEDQALGRRFGAVTEDGMRGRKSFKQMTKQLFLFKNVKKPGGNFLDGEFLLVFCIGS